MLLNKQVCLIVFKHLNYFYQGLIFELIFLDFKVDDVGSDVDTTSSSSSSLSSSSSSSSSTSSFPEFQKGVFLTHKSTKNVNPVMTISHCA